MSMDPLAPKSVSFEIETTVPLPVGEQIFLAGPGPVLGGWAPEGFPLTRVDDNLWTASVSLPSGAPVEFKITRGAWSSEEVLPGGRIPGNHAVHPFTQPVFRHRIFGWKDLSPGPAPRITGNYRIHDSVHSQFLRFDRRVIVWLPPFYERNAARRYPVLYMQDGQQVFDPQTSTWNHDWEVDEHCEEMILKGQLKDLIVVAVYSTEDRCLEYHPALAGAEYARFLIEELKPFIDGAYRTEPSRHCTAVAGSSMGGCISFYLAWTRPDVFFGAACLSPAFRFRDDHSMPDMVREAATGPDLKIYLYGGDGDATERELLGGIQEMETLLRGKGFDDQALKMRMIPGALHREEDWARVTPEWLQFLFGR